MLDARMKYNALKSRDARFDGVFFVGVTSTGIYCRPVCPARTPRQENCLFFETAEAAEKAEFRPCLRCRPELAPGVAPVDQAHRIAHLIVQRVNEDQTHSCADLEAVAARFGMSSRQLRRIVQKELGVSPIELLQTRRLLLAKQLLTETNLPVGEIAFASGFSSLRRFNDAFQAKYRMPPRRLRQAETDHPHLIGAAGTSTLQLSYRPPFDWQAMLDFLQGRMMNGVESVDHHSYLRTVRLGNHAGWIRAVDAPEKHALMIEFTHSLMPVLPALLERLRHLFDLNARPDLIADHLATDPRLRESVRERPGLRLPGAFDGFEMAVRAVLGQQITVKAATTLAGRFAAAFGEPITTPFPELTRLSPSPATVARVHPDELARLGIIGTRSNAITALARASLPLNPCADPETAI